MILVAGAVVFLLASVTAWAATGALIPLMKRRAILDVPNARSSHAVPRPWGGGLGILAGMIVGGLGAWALGLDVPGPAFFVGVALMAAVGFADDRAGGISAWLRLLLQIAAAGLVVYEAGGLTRFPFPAPLDWTLGWLGIPVALIWIVGVTNLYNFLDGIDGYAGVQGVIAGLGMACLSILYPPLGFGAILAGACSGFLLHNWHPSRIFMGDVGAYTLGFMLAALPFELDPAMQPSVVFAMALCLWFFLSDGTFTIVRRLVEGEKVWTAHRTHLYQRLVLTGLTHSQVVLRVGAAAMVVAGLGVFAVYQASALGEWAALVCAFVSFIVYYKATTRREQRTVGPDADPVADGALVLPVDVDTTTESSASRVEDAGRV